MDLDTDLIPDELLCSTHPALMFNREIVRALSKIELTIGREKIYAAVLVNAKSSSHDTVLEQLIDVTMRLVSHDYDHKAWNYSDQFDRHIHPKKNRAVQLKKQRFNRFVLASALLIHHRDDIVSFLDKYEHVTNSLACIVRSFADNDVLFVMAAATAIIGVHLVEPYLSLTYHETVSYEKLIPAMQQLYDDLRQADPAELLGTFCFSNVIDSKIKSLL